MVVLKNPRSFTKSCFCLWIAFFAIYECSWACALNMSVKKWFWDKKESVRSRKFSKYQFNYNKKIWERKMFPLYLSGNPMINLCQSQGMWHLFIIISGLWSLRSYTYVDIWHSGYTKSQFVLMEERSLKGLLTPPPPKDIYISISTKANFNSWL